MREHFGEAPNFSLPVFDTDHGRLERQDIVSSRFRDVEKREGIQVAEMLLPHASREELSARVRDGGSRERVDVAGSLPASSVRRSGSTANLTTNTLGNPWFACMRDPGARPRHDRNGRDAQRTADWLWRRPRPFLPGQNTWYASRSARPASRGLYRHPAYLPAECLRTDDDRGARGNRPDEGSGQILPEIEIRAKSRSCAIVPR